MNYKDVKIYLIISFILIVLFLLLIFYPSGKKSSLNNPFLTNKQPTPTSIELNNDTHKENFDSSLIISPAEFTGVSEEEPPEDIKNQSIEKQNLRNLVPFDSGLYKIDFDYSEDKFIVYLNEPKDKSKQEFLKWLKENYPNLPENQFNFR